MATNKIATEIKYIKEVFGEPLERQNWIEFIFMILFVSVALVSLVVEYGVIYSCLWNWYISPITNFTNINSVQGIGLCFFIYAVKNSNSNEEDTNRTLRAFLMFFVPLGYLFVAWLFHYLVILISSV